MGRAPGQEGTSERMSSAKSFKYGGVELTQRRHYDHEPLENAFLPINAYIPLRELDQEAKIIVTEGMEVREGQLLARGEAKGSANVHSSVPGYVRRIIRTDGERPACVVVALAGSFSILGKRPERYLWKSLNRADFIHIVQEKGLVQTSTGSPLHELLHACHDGDGQTLVLNALEMDPCRRTEEAVLVSRLPDVLDALAMLQKILKPASVTIAVDQSFPQDEKATLERQAAERGASVAVFKRRFPQDMPVLIDRALRPEGAAGAPSFVVEPTTAVALHDAVVANKAHVEVYVHVGGGAVKASRVLKARLGTPIGELIEECGGLTGKPDRVVLNDALRGPLASSLDVPVGKTTRAVLALTREETRSARELPCVHCGACVKVCPEGLRPYMIQKLAASGRAAEAEAEGLSRCILCGACSYVCWSRIPLVRNFQIFMSQGKL